MTDELKEFLIDTAYRAAYTFAEAFMAFIAVGSAISDINWGHALSVSAVAVLLCVLKQIGVYASKHSKPQYSEAILEELMRGVEEPADSWDEVHFTDEQIAAYRAEMTGGDEDV